MNENISSSQPDDTSRGIQAAPAEPGGGIARETCSRIPKVADDPIEGDLRLRTFHPEEPDLTKKGSDLINSEDGAATTSKDRLGMAEREPAGSNSSSAAPKWSESGATCIACGIGISLPGFNSAGEQREHFKTDWHRYNVRRRLCNQPPASEEHFSSLIDDHEVSSISGSGSDSEDDEGSRYQLPLLPEGDCASEDTAGACSSSRLQAGLRNEVPQYIFRAADERYLAVWRCLLCQDHVRGHAAAAIADPALQHEQLRLLTAPAAPLQQWMLIMLRGGHFAAAVLRRAKAAPGTRLDPSPEPFEVVDHKTFHRYVVRAKAGGKQSGQDGKFHSAGSRLRAYNESALENDIQELLLAWAHHLAASRLIFVSAPSSNSKAVFGAGGGKSVSPLASSDPRVRRIPFMTQRPTFSEVKRVTRLLASVFEVPLELIQQRQRQAQDELDAAATASDVKKQKKLQKEMQQLAVEAARSRDKDSQALPQEELGRSMPLHRAAKSGDADRVGMLLESGRQDPTARDEQGRTPYAIAADKAVRDAFRRYMAREPTRWNWISAGVPSALTEDMEATQLAKKADKKAKLKAKEKDRKVVDDEKKKVTAVAAAAAAATEIAQAAAEAAALSTRLGNMRGPGAAPAKVGGAGPSRGQAAGRGKGPAASGKGAKGPQAPPTPEEMARRREMMAAAAEARMQALQQQSQQQKLW